MALFEHGYAVLIGVGTTNAPTLSLPVTALDAQAIQAILTNERFCGYPDNPDHVRLLHDAGATSDDILKELAWLKTQAQADPDATVVVYYSGHGWLDTFANEYFLLSYETDPDDIPNTALPAQSFTAALREIPAQRLFVVVDSCHAEGMATAKNIPETPGDLIHSGLPKGVINALKQGEGRAVFTSSRGTQYSWICADGSMSLYTYHLLEALQGAANQPGDTLVRLSNLMNYLGQRVPESARVLQGAPAQTPFFDTAAEDFPVALLCGGKGLSADGWQPDRGSDNAGRDKIGGETINVTIGNVSGESQLAVGKDIQQIHVTTHDGQPQIFTGPVNIYDGADPEQALNAYLRRIFQTTLELDLGGIDPKVAGTQRDACLDLPEVYTALLTMSTAAHETQIQEKREMLERERLRSAVEMLNAEKRLVLLGDPGSGKSMFVNFVALCMAGELLHEQCANRKLLVQPLPNEEGELEEQPQPWDWNGLLPVKFVLRDVAAKALPKQPDAPGKVKHLLDYLEQLLTDSDLSQAFPALKAHLDSQGGMVLFDGLDEVPEAEQRRLQILQAVEDFAKRFSKCRILVTCRSYAYQKQEWRLKNFPVALLSPFSDGQIRWFVNGWYDHVSDKRDTNRENWQGRAELLKQAIFRSPQLHSFARRPLLLTLMASLHAWRGGSLPEKRVELYEDATDMLLETWVEKKVVRAADGTRLLPSLEKVLNVSKNDLKPVLQQLAFEAHQRQPVSDTGTADIPEPDLIAGLLEFCRKEHINPLDLTEHLSNRVGLLASHGNRVYTFPHRSFQEYLAACHLTMDENYPYNIAQLVRESPDRWREIALLAAAATSKYSVMFDGFVNALCPETAPETPHTAADVEAYAAILAAQAVVEAEKIIEIANRKPKQVTWLREWLKVILAEQQPQHSLPALERAQAGNLLAAFGDDRPGVGVISPPGRVSGLPEIEWCEVAEGTFLMGSTEDDEEAYSQEKPQHEVCVSAFEISRYPITNAQYRAFIEDGGYTEKWRLCWTDEGWKEKEEDNWNGHREFHDPFGFSNHPVVGVSWYEATAFCKWLTRALTPTPLPEGEGLLIRLPTEAEWEYAARGPENRKFPWKEAEITSEYANYGATNLNATSAVGCFPKGRAWCGVEEMAGNVLEWCLDAWYDSYEDAPKDGSARERGGEPLRVYRGGGWCLSARYVRGAYRVRYWPLRRDNVLGFRPVGIYQ